MASALRGIPRVLPFALLAACTAKPPATELPADWSRAVAAVADRESMSALFESRLAAYTSIAVYEGYAADSKSNLRSMAGQLNGLWSLPAADPKTPIDGAAVAAEAARIVMDSLLGPGRDSSRRVVDSIALAHATRRQRDGVRTEVRERSLSHGRALGAALVSWAADDGYSAARRRPVRVPVPEQLWWGNLRTFALRNASECTPPPMPAMNSRTAKVWAPANALYASARVAGGVTRETIQAWSDSVADASSYWGAATARVLSARRVPAPRAAAFAMLVAIATADAVIASEREAPRTSARSSFPELTTATASAWTLARTMGDSIVVADSTGAGDFAPTEETRRALLGYAAASVGQAAMALNAAELGKCLSERVRGRLRTSP